MTEPIPDLIPDDLAQTEGEPPPVAILRAQASRLAAKTKNVVLGEVVVLAIAATEEESEAGLVLRPRQDREYGFHLIVPSLDNYTYQAFRISYPVTDMYPVRIEGAIIPKKTVAKSREQFIEALRSIFSSPQFLRVINSLMREAMAMTA